MSTLSLFGSYGILIRTLHVTKSNYLTRMIGALTLPSRNSEKLILADNDNVPASTSEQLGYR